MKLIKNVIPSDYSELSSLAKRGILVFACGGKTAVAGKNQDPSLCSGRHINLEDF
jgi:hypothetical protein